MNKEQFEKKLEEVGYPFKQPIPTIIRVSRKGSIMDRINGCSNPCLKPTKTPILGRLEEK